MNRLRLPTATRRPCRLAAAMGAVALVGLLSGCYVAPPAAAYAPAPSYGYYGSYYYQPYYGYWGGYGWHDHDWHDYDWHDHDWHDHDGRHRDWR